MSFIWPVMLLTLLSIPLFIGFYSRLQLRRRRLIENFTQFGLVQEPARNAIVSRRHLPAILFLIGLIILLFSLARPQAAISLPRIEGTVILAFDVSGSMAADDLDPTRMEAAKEAAREFVANQPSSILIGVVAFSDSGFSIQSPTNDKETILAAIERLSPQRGTSLANGIYSSLNVISPNSVEIPSDEQNPSTPPTPTPLPPGSYVPAIIVLLTDGENTMNPDPLEAASAAVDRGVRIYTIGVGSPEGTTLEIEDFLVYTQLDEEMLIQISEITDGIYYNAQSEKELREIYDNLEPQLVVKTENIEVTSVFAGVSMLVLLLAGSLSLFWFGRLL